jgi:hypothetical protein
MLCGDVGHFARQSPQAVSLALRTSMWHSENEIEHQHLVARRRDHEHDMNFDALDLALRVEASATADASGLSMASQWSSAQALDHCGGTAETAPRVRRRFSAFIQPHLPCAMPTIRGSFYRLYSSAP